LELHSLSRADCGMQPHPGRCASAARGVSSGKLSHCNMRVATAAKQQNPGEGTLTRPRLGWSHRAPGKVTERQICRLNLCSADLGKDPYAPGRYRAPACLAFLRCASTLSLSLCGPHGRHHLLQPLAPCLRSVPTPPEEQRGRAGKNSEAAPGAGTRPRAWISAGGRKVTPTDLRMPPSPGRFHA
jgi:hypothetical protein